MQIQELPVRRSLQQAMADAAFEANAQSLGPITVGYPVQDFEAYQFDNVQDPQNLQRSISMLLRFARISLALTLFLTMMACSFDVMNLWFVASAYHLQINPKQTSNTSLSSKRRLTP